MPPYENDAAQFVVGRKRSVLGQDAGHGPTLLDMARQIQRARAKVAELFPREVFRNSAWDMMLELFVAGQQTRTICVKELILISGESSTSALRRIDRLESTGMLRRCHDPVDHRRLVVTLTPKGDTAMQALLHHLFVAEYTGNGKVATGEVRKFGQLQ